RAVRGTAADGHNADRYRPDPAGVAASCLTASSAAARPVNRRRIAIVTGGRSSEHEIALASARSVVDALDPARYDAVTVEIGRDGPWTLPAGSPRAELEREAGAAAENLPVPASSNGVVATLSEVDVVIPVLHGPFGEDGTVQGLLELAGKAYVGAGVLGSAV